MKETCSLTTKNKINYNYWLLLALLLISSYVFYYFIKTTDFNNFIFADSDCYMRLIRVKELYLSGAWFDNTIPSSNYPFGEVLHWSRPFDLLLLAGTCLGMFFTEFGRALYWSGVFISPVLYILAVIAVYWLSAAIYKQDDLGNRLYCVLIFNLQISVLYYFDFGRPDHHSLLILLFILQSGCVLRMLAGANKYIYLAASLSALAMWVSIEALVSVVIVVVALFGLCLVYKTEDYFKITYKYLISVLSCLTVFYLLGESLSSDPLIVYDKLSIVHLVVFVVALLVFFLWKRFILADNKTYKFFYLAAIATFALVILKVFPGLLNPFVDIDPRVYKVWLDLVNEVQPMNLFDKDSIGVNTLYLAPLIFSLPYCLKIKSLLPYKMFFVVSIAVYTILTFYQLRWSPYLAIIAIIPMSQLIVAGKEQIGRMLLTQLSKSSVSALLVLIVLLGPLAIYFKTSTEKSKSEFSNQNTKILNSYLKEHFVSPQVVLANCDFGAPLLYNSKHKVIATAYHRNYAGILYFSDVMSAVNYDEAYAALKNRSVDLIVISPTYAEAQMVEGNMNKDSFRNKLLQGNIPPWLEKIELPAELNRDFAVYKLKRTVK